MSAACVHSAAYVFCGMCTFVVNASLHADRISLVPFDLIGDSTITAVNELFGMLNTNSPTLTTVGTTIKSPFADAQSRDTNTFLASVQWRMQYQSRMNGFLIWYDKHKNWTVEDQKYRPTDDAIAWLIFTSNYYCAKFILTNEKCDSKTSVELELHMNSVSIRIYSMLLCLLNRTSNTLDVTAVRVTWRSENNTIMSTDLLEGIQAWVHQIVSKFINYTFCLIQFLYRVRRYDVVGCEIMMLDVQISRK